MNDNWTIKLRSTRKVLACMLLSWCTLTASAQVISNHYKDAQLFVCHWGTVDAPQADTFNGDPNELAEKITAPERIVIKAPGAPYSLAE